MKPLFPMLSKQSCADSILAGRDQHGKLLPHCLLTAVGCLGGAISADCLKPVFFSDLGDQLILEHLYRGMVESCTFQAC